MRRFLPFALLSGLVLLCVLVARAPARLMPLLLPGEQVLVQGLSGTLWRGEASRALVATEAGYLHLGRLQWRLKPLSLLLFSPALDFDSSWGGQYLRGEFQRTVGGSLRLEETEGRIDVGLLSAFLPVHLEGDLSLQLRELNLKDGLLQQLEGRVVWQGAGWQSPQGVRPLGDYAADLGMLPDGSIGGSVITLSGELDAQGRVSLRQSDYKVDLLLQGPGLDDPQLRQSLQLMAAPEGDGFRVKLEGAF